MAKQTTETQPQKDLGSFDETDVDSLRAQYFQLVAKCLPSGLRAL